MKITLKANNEIHRQIAMMCVGWYFFNGCKLIGVIKEGFVAETPYLEYMDEITIDLSKVDMDLRMAIGLPVEFIYYGRNVGSIDSYHVMATGDEVRTKWGDEDYPVSDLHIAEQYLIEIGVEVEE